MSEELDYQEPVGGVETRVGVHLGAGDRVDWGRVGTGARLRVHRSSRGRTFRKRRFESLITLLLLL